MHDLRKKSRQNIQINVFVKDCFKSWSIKFFLSEYFDKMLIHAQDKVEIYKEFYPLVCTGVIEISLPGNGL